MFGGKVFGREGEGEFFDSVDDGAGPFSKSVNVVTFGGCFVSVFAGVGESGMCLNFIRVTIEIRCSGDEGHFSKEGIDVVDWEERRGIQENTYEGNDASGDVGWDWWVFFLFAVKIGECGVSSSKGTNVLINIRLERWIFGGYKIL